MLFQKQVRSDVLGQSLQTVLRGGALIAASIAMTPISATQKPNHGQYTGNESSTAKQVSPDPVADSQAVNYEIASSLENKTYEIVQIVVAPDDFTRDKMLVLTSELKKDFPDAQQFVAILFDSENKARNYNPAGGSYYISKELERGEYYIDRAKGQETLYFSSQPGKPYYETKIVLNSGHVAARSSKKVKAVR